MVALVKRSDGITYETHGGEKCFTAWRDLRKVARLLVVTYQWRQMIPFTLFNIPIRVLPWFWLTMAFIGGVLNVDTKEEFFRLLLFMIAGFISILVHELGHALTAKSFGKQVEIVLQAFGGYAAYSGGAPLSRPKTLLVTAAGPAIQIVLGIVAFAFVQEQILREGMDIRGIAGVLRHASPAVYFWCVLGAISITWALLNLLPVLPLDGGRLLQTILGPARIKLTLMISIVAGVGIGLLYFQRTGSFLLPIFLGMFAYESYKALKGLSNR